MHAARAAHRLMPVLSDGGASCTLSVIVVVVEMPWTALCDPSMTCGCGAEAMQSVQFVAALLRQFVEACSL